MTTADVRTQIFDAFDNPIVSRAGARSRRPAGEGESGGQNVGVTQVGERVWLVTFMQYDLGYFDDEAGRVELINNRFGPKVLPMSSE